MNDDGVLDAAARSLSRSSQLAICAAQEHAGTSDRVDTLLGKSLV